MGQQVVSVSVAVVDGKSTGRSLPTTVRFTTTHFVVLAPDYKNPEADQFSIGWTAKLGQSRLFFDTEGIYVKGRNEIAIHDINWSGNATRKCSSGVTESSFHWLTSALQ